MKIVLAGIDAGKHAMILRELGYPYRLASYFYLQDQGPAPLREVLDSSLDGSEWIMDSGLFTLMFGSTEKPRPKTVQDFVDYAKRYVETMQAWGWQHAIVECDCQRIVGPEGCARVREEVMDQSGFEVIYVWHIPDGEEGLRKIAREKSRIALSVPELRAVLGPKRAKAALLKLIATAREEGNGRIHLLGCTERALLTLPADSADSTSWISPMQFGSGEVYTGGKLVGCSLYSPRFETWKKWVCEESRWAPGSIGAVEWSRRRYDTLEAAQPGMEWTRRACASIANYWLLGEHINQSEIKRVGAATDFSKEAA